MPRPCWIALLLLLVAAEPQETTTALPPARTQYKGRVIAQPMHHTGGDWLLRSTREKEEHCQALLEALDVQEGQRVADVGCGNGYYTLPLARAVGAEGKVYAVEIQAEYFEDLAARAEAAGIAARIEPVLGTVIDPRLGEDRLDWILRVDVYHEFSHPEYMLRALRRALKDEGLLVLVEFRLEDPSVPIKRLHKMSKEQILKELPPNGLRLVREFDQLPRQHVMFFERAPLSPNGQNGEGTDDQ
jgi:ubiquinone/menaquinone biosynthesis C-methylase UbiE